VTATVPRDTAATVGRIMLIVGALVAAMSIRVVLGSTSSLSGLVFAVLVGGTAVVAGWRPAAPRPIAIATGVAGTLPLCAVPLALRLGGHAFVLGPLPLALLPGWAVLILLISVAEEALLRGALFDVMTLLAGEVAAVAVAAMTFAVLHVPMYGWWAVPIDLAAGVWLGGLRLATRGVAAPSTAHALADLASWWLR
jgi:membrane protease YdiL (CAAX protease family)